MLPDVLPDDGMQPEPQLTVCVCVTESSTSPPPHVRLAVPGTGVVEVVLGVGVVEVVRVVGTGVVEVGLQWGQEYMTFLHVES